MPLPEATLDQHARYFDAHPDRITPAYLNNFTTKLPGTTTRKFWEGYPHVAGKLLPQNPTDILHSDLRKRQTLQEFFSVIDQEAAQVGTDPIVLYGALRALGYRHYDLVE